MPEFATAPSGKVKLTTVYPKRVSAKVTFVGEFEGQDYPYDFKASGEELAEKIREALRNKLGATVHELGDLEIEVGDRTAA